MIDDFFDANDPEKETITSKISSIDTGLRGVDAKGRARALVPESSTGDVWSLESHVCRGCFGRLVSRAANPGLVMSGMTQAGTRLYQCTNCGMKASGQSGAVLCACGLKIRKATRAGRSSVALADAGIRCVPNTEIRADFPSLFVALEVAPQA